MSWFSRRKRTLKNKLKPEFSRHALSFEVLEPRLLLSADAFGGVIDSDDMDVTPALLSNYDKIRDDLHFKLLQSNTLNHDPVGSNEAATSVLGGETDTTDTLDLSLLNDFFSGDAEGGSPSVKELVFVDSNTPDVDVLLEDAFSDEGIQVITIDSSDNALELITSEVDKYDGLRAIHIMSHGSSGSLTLGGETFDQAFLSDQENQKLLSSWQQTMESGADLLIYACNFAEGMQGKETLNLFADVTGLNAAASDDATGSYTFGGDWQLEYVVGAVDSQLVVSLDVQSIWNHSLATIVVNTSEDAPVFGNISIATLLNESEITLREAIHAVNNDFNFSGEIHTIEFQLDGDHAIDLLSQLPVLLRPMVIDGTSDDDYDGEAVVTINGSGNNVFSVFTNNAEIRGLNIENGSLAISVSGDDNVIAGNNITNNVSNGVYITGSNNTVGGGAEEDRNRISGNGDSGIRINNSDASGNVIQGNWIGLSENGSSSFGNSGDGLLINSASDTLVKDNVISGNEHHGVQIYRVDNIPTGHTIVGNIIGLDASGILTVGNGENGLELFEVSDIKVGDGTELGRNIISGNSENGIHVVGLNTALVTVSGNYIGTDITGTIGLGNGANGIEVYDGPNGSGSLNTWDASDSARIYIGGDQVEEGNVISANTGDGIFLNKDASFVTIVNNSIGLDSTGTIGLGNVKNGINVITGLDSLGEDAQVYIQGNNIAYNIENGITVSDNDTYGVYIFENSIFSNIGLSIDLGDDGRTQNDPADFDSGANRLLNFPEIHNVEIVDGLLNIQGAVHINPLSQGEITLIFYYAEDQRYSGDAYSTNTIANYSFPTGPNNIVAYEFNVDIDIPTGAYITASTLSSYQVGSSELTPAVQLGQGNLYNQAPTGEVVIAGSLIQGAVLTASNTLSDGNGMASSVQYQWRRNGLVIDGADEETYILEQVDVGALISLTGTYVDGQGNMESATGTADSEVANVNDPATGTLSIDGASIEDAVLTLNHSVSDLDGLASGPVFTYQWYRDDIAIDDADSKTYLLTDLDVGSHISASVMFTDLSAHDETLSINLAQVVENLNDLPQGDVQIDGVLAEDEVLTAVVNFSDDDGLPVDDSYTYQWYRDGGSVVGANAKSYTLGDADVGATIKVTVSYQDGHEELEVVESAASVNVANVNDDPDGNLSLSGSNTVGELLAIERNFTDADGINEATVAYQWYRDGVAITGATNASYLVDNTDIGTRLNALISYEDDRGTMESLETSQTSLVNSTNQSPNGAVLISGVVQEDQVLGVDTSGINDPDGPPTDGEYEYQWYRDGVAVINANEETYQLDDDDVSHEMSVRVSYEDGLGSNESLLSASTGSVVGLNDELTGQVSIVGNGKEGLTLGVNVEVLDDDGISTGYTYQWIRDGVDIAAEISNTYDLSEVDVGSEITVMVSYTDDQGTMESIESGVLGPIANVNQVPDGALVIQTDDVEEDQTLTATVSFTDVDGISADVDYTYQWFRDGEAVEFSDNFQYVLGDSDVGKQISAQVSYEDGHGTVEVVGSLLTDAVINVNDSPSGILEIVGVGIEGQLLTVNNSVIDNDGIKDNFGYQWYRDGVAITGAENDSYRLTNDDVQTDITVTWQYEDDGDHPESVASTAFLDIGNVNSTPSGSVTIFGDPIEDANLTVINTLSDEDGIRDATVAYAWYRDGNIIDDANSDSYQVGDADSSAMLNVIVSYTDEHGTEESVASTAFGEIIATNDEPTGTLTLVGGFEEDNTVVLVNTVSDVDGIASDAVTNWYRDGELIDGFNGIEYLLTQQDVGTQISVQYVYTDLQGFDEVVSAVSPMIENVNDLPEGSVQISGLAQEDQLLELSHNVTDEDGIQNAPTIHWYRDGVEIDGENSTTYQLTGDDYNTQIYASLDFVDNFGFSEQVISNQTQLVSWVNHEGQGDFTLVGGYTVGSLLQLNHSIEDPDGVATAFQFQWQRDGSAIEGAVSEQYEVETVDQGSTLSVLVRYTDTRGFDEVLVSPPIEIPLPGLPVDEPFELEPIEAATMLIRDDLTELNFNYTVSESVEELSAVQSAVEDSVIDVEAETASDVDSEEASSTRKDNYSERLSALFGVKAQYNSIFETTKDGAVESYNFTQKVSVNRLAPSEIAGNVVEWVPTELSVAGVDMPSLNEMLSILNEPTFSKRLDDSVEELQKDNVTLTNTVIGGTAAASTGLSVGYLLWTLRSGVLMTSLLSSLPAWRFIDPLPILGNDSKKNDEDDETLESMLEAERVRSNEERLNRD